MEFVLYLSVFVIGLVFGSFMNVIVLRMDSGEKAIKGRSRCPDCLHKLVWFDLVPVLSFLLLKRKCRYCSKKISFFYPAGELTMAFTFFLLFWVNGLYITPQVIYYLILIFLFVSLAFFDFKYLILPDSVTFSIGGLALAYNMVFVWHDFLTMLIAGLAFGLAFGIIYLVSKGEWMGFGDVKLVFAIGLVLGYPLGFLAILVAVWSAALWGLLLISFKRANLKTALPFGSFLSASTLFFIIFKNIVENKIYVIKYFF